MSFPRYPKYKASGVEWLGEVPEHWKVVSLRYLADCLDGVRVPLNAEERARRPGEVPYWGANCVVDYVDGALVSEPVVLLGEDGAPFFDKTKQVAFHVTNPIWPNNHVHVLRPREYVVGQFLTAVLNATDFAAFIAGSTRDKLTQASMNAIPVPLPPLAEQRAIAAFLDRETKKIDELVAAQERLIELLKEKRQAVISHAVTKGLDPAAPMKPSGVEWLGDVPAHWEVVPIGHRGRLQNGLSIGGEAFGSGDPFVTYGDVYKNARLPLVPSGLVRSSTTDQQKYGLVDGDVLFTRTSETIDDIGIAATCLQPLPRATFAGFLIRFRPHEGVLEPRYSTYLFRNEGVQGHFAGTMNLVTRASLSQGELRALPICIPPIHEQRAIAAFLDRETAKIDELVAQAESAISLLTERRSALISAAVTGQIDVRNAVPEVSA